MTNVLPTLNIDATIELQLEGDSQLSNEELIALIKNHPNFEEEFTVAMHDLVVRLMSPKYKSTDIFSVGTTIK